MKSPKVSVIIPTYNRAALIGEALKSALNQTWRDLEVIVVDDGSTDRTQEILQPFASQIRYLHQSNKGKSAALNLGVRAAHGEWIAILDSDDSWYPQKLERQFLALRHFSNCKFCFTDIITNGDPSIIGTAFTRRGKQFAHPFGHIANAVEYVLNAPHAIYIQTALVHADIIARIGGFDEALFVEDTDAIFRISLETEFIYVNEPLVCVDRTPKRTISLVESYEQDPSLILRCQERTYNKWLLLKDRLDEKALLIIQRRISEVHNSWCNWHIARGDWAAARQSLRQGLAFNWNLKLRIKQALLSTSPQFMQGVIARRVAARQKEQRGLFLGAGNSPE